MVGINLRCTGWRRPHKTHAHNTPPLRTPEHSLPNLAGVDALVRPVGRRYILQHLRPHHLYRSSRHYRCRRDVGDEVRSLTLQAATEV